MFKYVLAWFPLLIIAILNGVLREALYADSLGELQAHQLSTATGVVFFGAYIWLLVRIWRPSSPQQAISIGVIWLGLTVAFEFLFMHFVAGHSWETLLHDYNIFAGRVWLVILVWVTIAPYLFYRLQKPGV